MEKQFIESNSFKKEFTKNIEVNGRFAGNYSLVITGDYGKRAESSIYYKIGLDILGNLPQFEIGDRVILSYEKEHDFWKRFKLYGISDSDETLFYLEWIVGNEILYKGQVKESVLSQKGKLEAEELLVAQALNIFPDFEEKRNVLFFNSIYRTPHSYLNRPYVSTILSIIEKIFQEQFSRKSYAAPFFVLNLACISQNSPYSQPLDKIADFYIKHGYSPTNEGGGENLLLIKDTVKNGYLSNISFENKALKKSNRIDSVKEKEEAEESGLFEWGDVVKIISTKRDILSSKPCTVGMKGIVIIDEKPIDCGMIKCLFKELGSDIIDIHYSHLKKVNKV